MSLQFQTLLQNKSYILLIIIGVINIAIGVFQIIIQPLIILGILALLACLLGIWLSKFFIKPLILGIAISNIIAYLSVLAAITPLGLYSAVISCIMVILNLLVLVYNIS